MSTPLADIAAGFGQIADGFRRLAEQQPAPSTDGAVTIKEAAKRLGVSKAHVYQQARAGALKVLRIGRSVTIPEAELQAFMRRRLK